ncbi:MAG: hypothetical protein QXN08_08960 [Nitrososphaerales archaeon]
MSEGYLRVDVDARSTAANKILDVDSKLGVKALAYIDGSSGKLKLSSYLFDLSKGWLISEAEAWVKERHKRSLRGFLKESFSWLQSLEHIDNQSYIKIVALNAGTTLNKNFYLEEELIKAARTLIGKPVWYGSSHDTASKIHVGSVEWAEYEDERVECIASVNEETYNLVKKGEIQHASIEASYLYTENQDNLLKPRGLIFEGILLLTKDAQPGDPNTSVAILERLNESVPTQTQGRLDLGGLSSKEVIKQEEIKTKNKQSSKTGVAGLQEAKEAESWEQQLKDILKRVEKLERKLSEGNESNAHQGKGIVASPREAQSKQISGIPSLRTLLGD